MSPFAHVEDPKIRSWPIEELGANSLIAKNRLTPRHFHNLDNELASNWSISSRISGFNNHFWALLLSLFKSLYRQSRELIFIFIILIFLSTLLRSLRSSGMTFKVCILN